MDIQSEDHSVVADFTLILKRKNGTPCRLCREIDPRVLAQKELLCRPDLHKILGLRKAFAGYFKVCARRNCNRRSRVIGLIFTSSEGCAFRSKRRFPGVHRSVWFVELMAEFTQAIPFHRTPRSVRSQLRGCGQEWSDSLCSDGSLR